MLISIIIAKEIEKRGLVLSIIQELLRKMNCNFGFTTSGFTKN